MANEKKRTTFTRQRKEEVWSKTKGLCLYCGILLHGLEFDIDHFVPTSRGGDDDYDNLAAACRPCNRGKGGRMLEEFRFYRQMNEYEARTSVRCSLKQAQHLESLGFKLALRPYLFWFEEHLMPR